MPRPADGEYQHVHAGRGIGVRWVGLRAGECVAKIPCPVGHYAHRGVCKDDVQRACAACGLFGRAACLFYEITTLAHLSGKC